MIVLDTAVLVYAVGGPHRLREPAQDILSAIAERRVRATTTVEVIQEFVHVAARRRERADAVRLATRFIQALRPLLRPDGDDLARGLDLYERCQRLGSFDAVLAAVTLSTPGAALVSSDAAFAEIAEIELLPLGGPDLARALQP